MCNICPNVCLWGGGWAWGVGAKTNVLQSCVGFCVLALQLFCFCEALACIVMLVVLVSVEVMNCSHSMTYNGQVLLQVGNSLNVQPGTAAQ